MFKHYLTYQFTLSFERACFEAIHSPQNTEWPKASRTELARLSHQLVQHVSRAVHSRDPAEQARAWFVALHYLGDCEALLAQLFASQRPDAAIDGRRAVLRARLEELCTFVAGSEQGELRLFA